MKPAGIVIISVLLLSSAISCRKIEHLPDQPRIEFTSFEIFDTVILDNETKAGRLKFYFEDGNGDLGLDPPDDVNGSTDSTNLFFTLYRKTGGTFTPAGDDDPLKPSDYRIPYMERLGQNKILKGTIKVSFYYLFYEPTDTIKYEFYIRDRAGLVSNTATTCEIVVNVNGICTGE